MLLNECVNSQPQTIMNYRRNTEDARLGMGWREEQLEKMKRR